MCLQSSKQHNHCCYSTYNVSTIVTAGTLVLCAGGTGVAYLAKLFCSDWLGNGDCLPAVVCDSSAVDPVHAGCTIPGVQKAAASLAERLASWHHHGEHLDRLAEINAVVKERGGHIMRLCLCKA